MTDHNTKAAIGGALIVIVFYTLQQFAIELGAGHVPIPAEYQWTVPIATALITGVASTLTPTMRREAPAEHPPIYTLHEDHLEPFLKLPAATVEPLAA